MGHAEAFSGGDAVARFAAMRGNVLSIDWLGRIRAPGRRTPRSSAGSTPKEWTYANIEQQARSFRRMGMSFDWTRRINDDYLWTVVVPPSVRTRSGVSQERAGELVPQGRDGPGERAGDQRGVRAVRHAGRSQDLTQWFFKITDYAQRLLDDIEPLDWPACDDDAAQLDRAFGGCGRHVRDR